jgi:hypothetical protein
VEGSDFQLEPELDEHEAAAAEVAHANRKWDRIMQWRNQTVDSWWMGSQQHKQQTAAALGCVYNPDVDGMMYRKDGAEFELCRPSEMRYFTARISTCHIDPRDPGPGSCHASTSGGAARAASDSSDSDSGSETNPSP